MLICVKSSDNDRTVGVLMQNEDVDGGRGGQHGRVSLRSVHMCMAESSEETSAECSLTYFVSPLLSVSI